jgi:hypothetical protein
VATFADLQDVKTQLIRKALTGAVFVAPVSAPVITTLTTATGTAPNQVIDLTELPEGYEDLGYTTNDGAAFSVDTTTSEVESWQSVSPSRSDITAETTTMTVTAQETKLLTLGLYTGVETAGLEAAAGTGELLIKKPQRPSASFYRLLSLAVDGSGDSEIWIAKFLPRAKITGRGEQSYAKTDDALQYPLTFQGFFDNAYGTAEGALFGGPGWLALLDDMGIEQAA